MAVERKYTKFQPKILVQEKSALDRLRLPGETDRMLLLRLAGIDASPIPRGIKSHRMVSHALGADSKVTDQHVVEGLDTGLMQSKLQAKMLRKQRGF